MIRIPHVDFTSRDLNTLDAEYKKKATAFLDGCRGLDLSILIYCTYRSPFTQGLLYAQGRSRASIDKKARQLQLAGFENLSEVLYKVMARPSSSIVTRAGPGESAHQHGLAFDFVPLRGGKPVWDDRTEDDLNLWLKAEAVANQLGLHQLSFERPHLEDESFQAIRLDRMRSLYLSS